MAQKKRVCLSLLEKNEGLARLLAQELVKAGLEVEAHFYEPKSWAACANALTSCQAWIIAGDDFAKRELRTSLSLTALSVQAELGHNFPILISSAQALEVSTLPTPLKEAEVVKSGLGVKACVRANTLKPKRTEYRLRPLDHLGLWFEVGPFDSLWQGAFLALGQREGSCVPIAHGVGIAGSIPEKCTLNFPVKGIKFQLKEIDCEGWGVKNELKPGVSYYLKVSECPDIISFGPFPETDEAELYTLVLN